MPWAKDQDRFTYSETDSTGECIRNLFGGYDCEIASSAAGPKINILTTMDISWSGGRFEGTSNLEMSCAPGEEEFCAILAEDLPLPCNASFKVAGVPTVADEFTPDAGSFSMVYGEATISTCKVPFTPNDDQLAELEASADSITLRDSESEAYECQRRSSGIAMCDRHTFVDDMMVTSEAEFVFRDELTALGAVSYTLDCNADDCSDLEATYGELPCTTIQPVRLDAESLSGM